MRIYTKEKNCEHFANSSQIFAQLVDWLGEEENLLISHDQLERELQIKGRTLLLQLFQDHLDLRAQRERQLRLVRGSDGVARSNVEDSSCQLGTIFGEVTAHRLAYRKQGHGNLHPSDCVLNLPKNKHSHEMCRLSAVEASRGSFDDAVQAIERSTGVAIGKRQLEQIAQTAVRDFELFYWQRPVLTAAEDVLVLSCDGKGIVMLKKYLREATQKAAEESRHKLTTRLSKGEKRNRKRMATIGAVYDCTPLPRMVEDIISDPEGDDGDKPKHRPKTRNKWLTASVQKDTAEVVAEIFDEAQRRDPLYRRKWVV